MQESDLFLTNSQFVETNTGKITSHYDFVKVKEKLCRKSAKEAMEPSILHIPKINQKRKGQSNKFVKNQPFSLLLFLMK